MSAVEQIITENLPLWSSSVQLKSTRGRGSSSKRDLYGIKKLRELILDLAVRGLLVPQDPNDEPASVLLEKITSRKERLKNEGKLKKQKNLSEVKVSDHPYKLPNAWAWTKLGDVTNYGTADKAEAKDAEEDTWVLELEDVEKETSKLLKKMRFKEREFKSSKNCFLKGDVIYGKLRPYLDKVLVADESGVCTTEMIPIRAYDSITSEFLRLSLKSSSFKKYATNSTHGMNLPRLGTDKAREALIPLCSEAEQHRIVAKVDELMALCDTLEQQQENSIEVHETLVETLFSALTNAPDAEAFQSAWQRVSKHFDTLLTTEHSVDKLKETILQLAVMGKLVPQEPKDEPASKLLEKIVSERKKLIIEGKIKKQKSYSTVNDELSITHFPSNWVIESLGELAYIITDGTHHTPKYLDNGIPFISIKDIDGKKISFENCKYISSEEHLEINTRCNPQENDILLCRIGTLGRATLVDTEEAFSIFVSVGLIKYPQQFITPKYFHLILHSPFLTKQYDVIKAGGSHTNKLNLRDIPRLVIPIAPLAEQHRIVAKVDELMALCDDLKQSLNEAQTTQMQLTDAVVENAF